MNSRVLNIVPSLTPQDGSIREVHFTLQQLRILTAQGLDSGLMAGAYALPANFLTKEEIDKKTREAYERLWAALMGRSFEMGIEINDFMDVINKKIGEIRSQKDRLMGKDPTPEIIKEIAQLDRDEKHFKEFKKELNEIDDQRRSMSSEEDIKDVDRELKGFSYRFTDFIDTLRMRNKRNKFSMEADGLDTTSAHSTKRKNKPTSSSSGPNVVDMPPPAEADADLDEDDAFEYYDDEDEPQASAQGAKPKPDVA